MTSILPEIFAPPSTAPVGFVPKAIVTSVVKVVTALPRVSNAATWTAGVITLPATTPWGCAVNARLAAAAGVTSNGGLAVPRTPGAVATRV